MSKIKSNYVFVVMGVSGSGKTTIGKALAAMINYQFVDADDFHSQNNIAKMKLGIGLDDDDRLEWLATIKMYIETMNSQNKGVVLACSALRQKYRDYLKFSDKVQFIYLKIDKDTVYARLQNRNNHFAGVSLIESQFETLEEPTDVIVARADENLENILEAVKSKLFNFE